MTNDHPKFQLPEMSLLDVAKLFERTIVYHIRKARTAGDDEGANMQSMTLEIVRQAIAKAEGR